MIRRLLQMTPFVLAVALSQCAAPQADDEGLRASFAEQLATSAFVTDFTRDGDELNFSGPDRQGGTASWRVRIDTSLVEPNEFDDDLPLSRSSHVRVVRERRDRRVPGQHDGATAGVSRQRARPGVLGVLGRS